MHCFLTAYRPLKNKDMAQLLLLTACNFIFEFGILKKTSVWFIFCARKILFFIVTKIKVIYVIINYVFWGFCENRVAICSVR